MLRQVEEDEDPFVPEKRYPLLGVLGVICMIAGGLLFALAALLGLPSDWPSLLEYGFGGVGVGLIAVGYRLLKGEWFDLG